MARWVDVQRGFWKRAATRLLEDIRVDHALRRPLAERKHEGMVYARVVERSELEIEVRKVAGIQQKCLDRTNP